MKHISPASTIVIIICFLITACKETYSPIDINGSYLKAVKSNIIYNTSGDSVILSEDSISKIFYLTRHAEKDTLIKDDPPLTKEGLDRATKIADILQGTRIDVIYSTMTLRSMFTVDSLSDIKAMTIKPYDNKHLKDLIQEIDTTQTKNRIFIVGHSNTIPALTNSLAKRDVFTKTFDENEYNNFVIVVKKKSGENVVYRLKY